MDIPALIARSAHSVQSAGPALLSLQQVDELSAHIRSAIQRGYFEPREEEHLRDWQARYLTARAALFETICELQPLALDESDSIDQQQRLRCFTLAYTAVCLLVRAARFMVTDLADHRVVQRKLNEPEPLLRIPHKQYTRIYRSLTSPFNAWRLAFAIRYADDHRDAIERLADDEQLTPVIDLLRESEEALRVSVRQYLKARLRYRWHSYRRRRASAIHQAMFNIMEVCGSIIADISNPFHTDRITPEMRKRIAALLQPGDVIVARHDQALSNLFLPGFWPHAALYIGPPETRNVFILDVSEERAARWTGDRCVLEAKKDGVLFRPIDETLTNDAVAVIRPKLEPADIARALSQAIIHEGKLYNFDMDFFTSDRIVCTKVVYRAYHGIAGIDIPLKSRAGFLTFSAEDLLDLATTQDTFEPIAVYGTPGIGNNLVTGDDAKRALRESYTTAPAT